MNEQKLLDLRDYYDLTQKQIAEIIGVKRTTYSSWENMAVTIPLKHLNTLSNYYKVSMDYVLGLSSLKNDDSILRIKELDKKLIGSIIKEIRKENELTVRELAKILNTTPSTISAYENGKVLILTTFAYQICHNYHISLDYLCGKTTKKRLM